MKSGWKGQGPPSRRSRFRSDCLLGSRRLRWASRGPILVGAFCVVVVLAVGCKGTSEPGDEGSGGKLPPCPMDGPCQAGGCCEGYYCIYGECVPRNECTVAKSAGWRCKSGEGTFDCCPGTVCTANDAGGSISVCVNPNPRPPNCSKRGESCAGTRDCCEDAGPCGRVGSLYICGAEQTCGHEGGSCDGQDCCEGENLSCVDGVCRAGPPPCGHAGESCSGQDCCEGEGLSCVNSSSGAICSTTATPCAQSGESCAARDCCSGLICGAGALCGATPAPCARTGESCTTNDCCQGLSCTGEVCE
jgi:hypothetical protein